MSQQFIPHPPSPPSPEQPSKKNVTQKQLFASLFFLAAFALLIGVIIAPGDKSSTNDTVAPAPAPVITAAPAPAPVVNKYDKYLEHVYNNSGQANTMTKAKLIEFGDLVCQALDKGSTIAQVVNLLSSYAKTTSDYELFASVVYASINYLCSEYTPALDIYLSN